jgi:hypothetical protein
MSKGMNRERRREKQRRETAPQMSVFVDDVAKENKNETPLATLRLVRFEDGDVSVKQAAAGRPGTVVDTVQQPERSNGSGGAQTGGHIVGAAADDGTDGLSLVVRSFDAVEINKVYNDPSVFPLVATPDSGPIDATPLVADQRNVLLMAEGGGVFFAWQEPGVYEVHTAFLDANRGRPAIKASLQAYRWMFTHTDCMELLTRVPAINPAAEGFCKLVGATKEFERKAIWKTESGFADMSFWSLRYDDWVRKTTALKKAGQKFHKRLTEEYARFGRSEPLHDDEDCHDLHVGSCVEMIYGGQLDKAVVLYNRWARFSGYAQIGLVAHDPPVIDIGEALLQITGETFKVVLVR